jgi:hypothetical protein
MATMASREEIEARLLDAERRLAELVAWKEAYLRRQAHEQTLIAAAWRAVDQSKQLLSATADAESPLVHPWALSRASEREPPRRSRDRAAKTSPASVRLSGDVVG